eukprot:SAG31_NODE_2839_length_5017_cov_2.311102_4_plen_72_part_01
MITFSILTTVRCPSPFTLLVFIKPTIDDLEILTQTFGWGVEVLHSLLLVAGVCVGGGGGGGGRGGGGRFFFF